MRELASAIADAGSTVVHSSEHTATVTRVDLDGTVWVSIPGGADETPASTSLVSVSQGDTVKVLIANGRATVTGNATSPAANVTELSAVEQKADTATNAAVEAGSDAQRANEAAEAAMTAAEEATASAEAIGQHFWHDDSGAHVSEVERDTWNRAVLDDFDDYDSVTKPYNNLLLNSLGILLRTAIKNLVSITRSAVAFFDGNGNAASNVTASFGANGAQIGKTSGNHLLLDSSSLRLVDENDNLLSRFHGDGAEIGTSGSAKLIIRPTKIRMEDEGIGQLLHVSNDGTVCEMRLGLTEPTSYSDSALFALYNEFSNGCTVEDYYGDGTLYIVTSSEQVTEFYLGSYPEDYPYASLYEDVLVVYGPLGFVNSPEYYCISYSPTNERFYAERKIHSGTSDDYLTAPAVISAANTTLQFKNGRMTVIGNEQVVGTLDVGGRLSLGDGSTTAEAAVYAKLASRNAAAIRLIDYDVNGSAVVVGDGGLTVVGGGESASALYNALIDAGSTGGTEQLHLAADTNLYLHSNCQTVANRKSVVLSADGNIYNGSGGYYSDSDNLTMNTSVSATTTGAGLYFRDSAPTWIGRLVPRYLTNNNEVLLLESRRVVSGTSKYAQLFMGLDPSGDVVVSVGGTGAAMAWKKGLGVCMSTAIFTGKNVSNGGTIGTYTSVFDYRLFWAQLSGNNNNWCLCYRTGDTSTAGYIRGVGALDNGSNSYVFKTNISVSTAGVLKVVASSQHVLNTTVGGTTLYVSALYGIK